MKNLIPSHILYNYQNGKKEGSFKAYSLFIDISGFTAMTEKLAIQGRAGAEELSDILNFLFTTSVKAVYSHGGFIVNFAGDAFTALFQDYGDNPALADAVIAAAVTINGFFAKNQIYCSRYGSFNFGVKAGLAYGDAGWQIAENDHNSSDSRAIYYFQGSAVDNCAKAEHLAQMGDIILHSSFAKQLTTELQQSLLPVGDDGFTLPADILAMIENKSVKMEKLENNALYCELLEKFCGRNELNFPIGEFREIVSVFISFTADNPSELLQMIFGNREIFGGSQPKVDFGDKGGTVLLFFGAPVAYENNHERALKFILTLQKECRLLNTAENLKIRAGLADGLVYSGFNGSDARSEFTCLGNAVNLSARFMMRAEWDSVLISENLSATPGFKTELQGELSYKGRSELIKTYRLIGTEQITKRYSDLLCGRETEFSALMNYLNPLENGLSGGLVLISGAAGVGKSRLVHEVRQSFIKNNQQKIVWLELFCDELIQKSFNPFIHYLREFFNQSEKNGDLQNKTHFEQKLQQLLSSAKLPEEATELQKLHSLLGALLDLEWADSLYSQLDAKGRFDGTLTVLELFFKIQLQTAPMVINFDDLQWADESSMAVLNRLALNCNDLPLLILATVRSEIDNSEPEINLSDKIPCQRITLTALNRESIKTLSADRLQVPPDRTAADGFLQLVDFVYERCAGNPFYAEQILLYLQNSGLINSDFSLSQSDISATGSLQSVIMARIDRMEDKLAEMVKTASVFGKEFAADVLSAMLKELSGQNAMMVEKQLDCGEKDQIWAAVNELQYLFKHAMLRDVAYEMQLLKQLKKLHQLAGETYEKLYQNNLKPYLPDLAFHYDKAEIIPKALEFLEKAGNQEKENYRNQKAAEYFDRWAELAEIELGVTNGDFTGLEITAENRALVINFVEVNVRCRCFIYNVFLNQPEVGHRILDASLIMAEKTGDQNIMGLVIYEQGNWCLKNNQREQSLDFALKALECFKAAGNLKDTGFCYSFLGRLSYLQGKIEKAKDYYRQSAETASLGGFTNNHATALSALGMMFDITGEYDRAIELYEKSLAIYQELGNQKLNMQVTIGNLAAVYSILGDNDKALAMYRDKLQICKELAFKNGQVNALVNIGSVYIDFNQPNDAMPFFKQAKELALEIKAYPELCHILLTTGETLCLLQQYEESLQIYQQAEEIISVYNLINFKSNFLLGKAELQLRIGNTDEAEQICNEGLILSKKLSQTEYIEKCSELLDKIKSHKV